MKLGQLIAILSTYPPETPIRWGFRNPHSYRGDFYELAFEPCGATTVGVMLDAARSALDKTFTGYKGGKFTMDTDTQCWLCCYGDSTMGEGVITRAMLARILANEIPDDDDRWDTARDENGWAKKMTSSATDGKSTIDDHAQRVKDADETGFCRCGGRMKWTSEHERDSSNDRHVCSRCGWSYGEMATW